MSPDLLAPPLLVKKRRRLGRGRKEGRDGEEGPLGRDWEAGECVQHLLVRPVVKGRVE